MIHRDLKPANIILTDSGRVVLLDFSLCQVEHGSDRITGTPHYMAPEAIMHLDNWERPAIDIYALGIIAYQLLTGHTPYEGRHALAILRKHVRASIPALDRECTDVSEHLCRLVTEMLAKNPDDRPSTAGEVALWLQALRDGVREEQRSHRLSVLIADDDPEMRELLSACVEFADPHAQIRTVGNGVQALAMLDGERPQVLIVDIDMPGMGGVELCESLYRTKMLAHMAVLPVSGRVDEEIARRLAHLGVAPVVAKKQHSHQFLTEISAWMESMHTAEHAQEICQHGGVARTTAVEDDDPPSRS